MTHPYKGAPDRSFWSRSIARNWCPGALLSASSMLLRVSDHVASAGSCFAANMVPYLEKAGYSYVRTEPPHPLFREIKEPLGYDNFSASYGNIYTARQLLQLIRRCRGEFKPAEERWVDGARIVDPFRPGLTNKVALSHAEFDALNTQYLARVLEVFTLADVFVFTLGLTEAWVSVIDGAVFPACPGTVAGSFDRERHVFKNFSVGEIIGDLRGVIAESRKINPTIRFILTVSPVPLVATATDEHVLSATVYSKSVLRVAAGDVSRSEKDVMYFPAYEIVTGPQAPWEFFELDRRNVSRAAIDSVMGVFLLHCESSGREVAKPEAPVAESRSIAEQLSAAVATAECEEVMVGGGRPT
jgi:hypothetical protein